MLLIMGSGYFGEPSLGNERGSRSSSSSSPSASSRRGKKGGSDKQPRQPQRGLGVAQLEKIRLHGEIASAAFHPTSYTFNNVITTFRFRVWKFCWVMFELTFISCFWWSNHYWFIFFNVVLGTRDRSESANGIFVGTVVDFFLHLLWFPLQYYGRFKFISWF